MFLSQLNERNKEDFLKICAKAALSNGVFADEEKEILYVYCREMDIDEHIPDTSEDVDTLIGRLKGSTNDEEKRIIIFETLTFIKSDGTYDEKEQNYMLKLSTGLGLAKEDLERFDSLLEKYLLIEQELFDAIAE